jgi:hypothetical protein
MGDGANNGPEMSLASQGETLQGKEGISLYKSPHFNVFIPAKPNIPLNEGLHVKISDGHDALDSPKEVLARYLMAEGVAKELAESGQTPDAWANTRLEQGQTVSIYGRIPGVEESWRKPVNTLDRNAAIDNLGSNYNTQKLQELSGRYLPKWEQLAENIDLFKNGINGKDMYEASKEGFVVWKNENLKLEIIANAPHIKGLHLVVHPGESFQRQWQTVKPVTDDEKKVYVQQEQIYLQQTLEATAVAMGVQKLLMENKGEIHNSGNWAVGLKSTKEGGKLDLEKLTEHRKAEKRSHRPDIANPESQINTGMHVHIYGSERSSTVLPEMSKSEAIEKGRLDVVKQWEEIPPTSPAQLDEIRTKLGEGKLTKWLKENCKGKLYV